MKLSKNGKMIPTSNVIILFKLTKFNDDHNWGETIELTRENRNDAKTAKPCRLVSPLVIQIDHLFICYMMVSTVDCRYALQ